MSFQDNSIHNQFSIPSLNSSHTTIPNSTPTTPLMSLSHPTSSPTSSLSPLRFELYDQIQSQVVSNAMIKEPLPDTDTMRYYLHTMIPTLSDDEHELIYVLIRTHHLTYPESNTIMTSLPYKARKLKRGIKLDSTYLPIPLIRILYTFVKLYTNQN